MKKQHKLTTNHFVIPANAGIQKGLKERLKKEGQQKFVARRLQIVTD